MTIQLPVQSLVRSMPAEVAVTPSRRITVLGAGHIGTTIATMLAGAGHAVTLADASGAQLALVHGKSLRRTRLDAADRSALLRHLNNQDIVVSALPYSLNRGIAQAAVETGTHYFDLTEDVATTAFIRALAVDSPVAMMPQCGLAPGFICVLGAEMAQRFEHLHSLHMRVGALPRYPTNALRYNVTWSIDGLINEYCNPCEIIHAGQVTRVPALEGLEQVLIDGVAYEAFNTSGGLGTLTETLAGQVDDMSYKTLRYPGHAEIMKLLLQGLALAEDRPTLRRILERAAPFTPNDVVVIFVTGIGERRGRMEEDSIILRYESTAELGAIQLTTAAGCVAMIELFLTGRLPARGFLKQEDARLEDYLGTVAGQLLLQKARGSETH
ncbi:saccharopine dehydrogenase family protein [Chelatococcus asaccharovorans]|uniref:saccharopine dehydrogenase family protein n=1 Tax=Chelatococcus asaccharovorans TaxID=28210 RepID=UPI00224C6F24|nr:saccharopine dehydrogenase C-terminal domain-containing protein [Chelatococcus asaccharovorans]CAH1668241.1 Saccharopine dehydrogenase-like NADP-dependent oxidoreductase [Chelatococcus asaccharovorans]CAH1680270.1 Saccharopine dehydrogenase-like NADP-dependent oxidoreductase [Chelatococcus asaccharovorans]